MGALARPAWRVGPAKSFDLPALRDRSRCVTCWLAGARGQAGNAFVGFISVSVSVLRLGW
jgi:hypothetical protein